MDFSSRAEDHSITLVASRPAYSLKQLHFLRPAEILMFSFRISGKPDPVFRLFVPKWNSAGKIYFRRGPAPAFFC